MVKSQGDVAAHAQAAEFKHAAQAMAATDKAVHTALKAHVAEAKAAKVPVPLVAALPFAVLPQ